MLGEEFHLTKRFGFYKYVCTKNKIQNVNLKSFSEYNFAGFGFDFGYILISRHR